MYEIKVLDEFCGAHNLRHYKGKCEALHGHNWKIEVTVYSNTLDKCGMIIDFKELKSKLEIILLKLDHKYLNDLAYFKKKNPTSENIAATIYSDIRQRLAGISISSVEVCESPGACVTYLP